MYVTNPTNESIDTSAFSKEKIERLVKRKLIRKVEEPKEEKQEAPNRSRKKSE